MRVCDNPQLCLWSWVYRQGYGRGLSKLYERGRIRRDYLLLGVQFESRCIQQGLENVFEIVAAFSGVS